MSLFDFNVLIYFFLGLNRGTDSTAEYITQTTHNTYYYTVIGRYYAKRKVKRGGSCTIQTKLDRYILGIYSGTFSNRKCLSRVVAKSNNSHTRLVKLICILKLVQYKVMLQYKISLVD